MALNYANTDTIREVLRTAWQRYLGTDWDPGEGKWYTSGDNSTSHGLYGGLTDTLDHSATMGQPSYSAADGNATETIAVVATVDNTDGLLKTASTVTLSHTFSTTKSYTHTTTSSLRIGISQSFSLHVGVPTESFGETTTISMDMTATTSDSNQNSETESTTFSQSVPVLPPSGKIYQVILTYKKETITVPYSVNLSISGITDAWFNKPWSDHNAYGAEIGKVVCKLSNQDYEALNLTPADWTVSADGNSISTVGMVGEYTCNLVGDFKVKVVDITGLPQGFSPGGDFNTAAMSGKIVAG